MKEYKVADLTHSEMSKLREMEQRFNDECSRELVLIAWDQKNTDVAPESSSRVLKGE